MKPGYKTTEFWVTLLTTGGTLLGAIAGALPGTSSVIVVSISSGLYAIARSLAKTGN